MSFKGLYDIRPGKREDKNFVLATFLKGIYYGDSWFSLIPKGTFMTNYAKVAEAIVQSPNTRLIVACLKEDPDTIIGYSLVSADAKTLHFVYIKGGKDESTSWRRKGIGRSLIPNTIEQVSHLTMLGRKLLIKLDKVVFNPFIGV